jgi:hypothetical protein
VLAGSAAGLLAAVVSGHVLSVALMPVWSPSPCSPLIRFRSTWQRAAVLPGGQ